MKKSAKKRWTKRKLWTYGLKGRARRALLWRKSVYREWWEYAQLGIKAGFKMPDDMGFSQCSSFDEWWFHEKYGFELFCEPVQDDEIVKVIDTDKPLEQTDRLVISVARNADRDKVLDLVKRLLKSENIQPEDSARLASEARKKPSKEPKDIFPDKLASYRETYELIQSGMKHKDVVKTRQFIPSKVSESNPIYDVLMDSALRRVGRHKKTVLNTLKRMEMGVFP